MHNKVFVAKVMVKLYYSSVFIDLDITLIYMYDVIYQAEIALFNINKLPLQLSIFIKV